MTSHHVEIENVKGLVELKTTFDFSTKKIVVITGKNGTGKTTLVKAFKLISDQQVFKNTSSMNSIGKGSRISFELNDHPGFSFTYNDKLKALDTKQVLPPKDYVRSELPIPYGDRFQQFSLVAKFDSEIRANIASSDYQRAEEVRDFLSQVYPGNDHFSELKTTRVKKNQFYFILQPNDYYIREDHFSSGEFFLIQLYRLITSEAKLIIIDELDISLDASAQVHFFNAIQPFLDQYNSHLIVISHSLAFMETVDDGCLYYHEQNNGLATLEQRSFGYIKSDLYGFLGRDRYIITEDDVLAGFIEFLIRSNIKSFYKYEIIPVGGQPQIDALTKKNDDHAIFGPSINVIVIIDKDIQDRIKYDGPTEVFTSPVDDIELFLWENRARLLPDVKLGSFKEADKPKKTAKTYWKKIINSGQKSPENLYQLVIDENSKETRELIEALEVFLCLN